MGNEEIWTVVKRYAIYPMRCPCDIIFDQNFTILEQSSLPHVSCLKHASNLLGMVNISSLSNSDSAVIQNHFLHCFKDFIGC